MYGHLYIMVIEWHATRYEIQNWLNVFKMSPKLVQGDLAPILAHEGTGGLRLMGCFCEYEGQNFGDREGCL